MSIDNNRNFMKCPAFADEMAKSDQQNGVAAPPVSKAATGPFIVLPPFEDVVKLDSYTNLLDIRRSVRVYDETVSMTQAQLAYMLHTAMCIQELRGDDNIATLRPAPSGGSRHPFELYIAVKSVEGLNPGFYRYVPLKNVGEKAVTIEYIGPVTDYVSTVTNMVMGQKWATEASCTLFISCIPYRAEWRYRELAHRVVLIDLGHVGQNIMLSAAALGLGSCCIAAFEQDACDKALGLDGKNEYTVYAISVGNPREI